MKTKYEFPTDEDGLFGLVAHCRAVFVGNSRMVVKLVKL